MLQCQGSDLSGKNPNRAALASSHVEHRVERVAQLSKSTASPISCMERPGMAVGTRQLDAGAFHTSGQPLMARSSAWRCVER